MLFHTANRFVFGCDGDKVAWIDVVLLVRPLIVRPRTETD